MILMASGFLWCQEHVPVLFFHFPVAVSFSHGKPQQRFAQVHRLFMYALSFCHLNSMPICCPFIVPSFINLLHFLSITRVHKIGNGLIIWEYHWYIAVCNFPVLVQWQKCFLPYIKGMENVCCMISLLAILRAEKSFINTSFSDSFSRT